MAIIIYIVVEIILEKVQICSNEEQSATSDFHVDYQIGRPVINNNIMSKRIYNGIGSIGCRYG